MHINQVEFTIFDTETTGLDFAAGERIIEIAGIRFKDETLIGEFDSLINTGRPVSPGAFAVNKISESMLASAPGPEKVIADFLNFSSASCLASYNTEFDMGFLNSELARLNFEVKTPAPVVDILILARNLLPGLPRYALWFVAEKLGIKNNQKHRALADVGLTLQVFQKLKSIFLNKGLSEFEAILPLATPLVPGKRGLSQEKLATLQEAVSAGRKIAIQYISVQDGRLSERTVIPRQLRQDARYNYLVAYCCLKQEERTFRVENILDFKVV